ncbi:recombinase family protein [Actinacidiphila sp. DG2A-62]|uniref:recombinase family protein n=1 Tax=Actinacidiphila sp. DG2A-62 TaxID=3108821 RepID=UPI002DBCFE0B|nr:recombinase family protein [Actinacidiphila sp. DG2A-62]MEC3996773.1 recombinase family protein [Actinacidiphila sp. DG2A-62]
MDSMVGAYCGCGKCMLGVRRLSRKSDATSSPERQEQQVLSAVSAIGGHVIAWADDWEISGATDPRTRPALGPWLRDEMGPYSGIAGAAVDRIGRNQRDVLNTAYAIHESGRLLVTFGHDGPWDLDDPMDEMRLSMESFGAQMELRSIQKRNRDDTVRARAAGEPKQKNSYGYRFVRLFPTAKVDHVEIDPVAAEVIRNVAKRILTDRTGKITVHTEAARLNREGVLSPSDHRAVMYGRAPRGVKWDRRTLRDILISEAALGYLIHGGRAVLGRDGHPVRLADGLWDRTTRSALITATAPKETGTQQRAPKGERLLSAVMVCGVCGQRAYVGNKRGEHTYRCIGRMSGWAESADCKPAPQVTGSVADATVTGWFLDRYGSGQVMRREFDPGTGHAQRIAELEADRARLRDDRRAGLYDAPDDTEWFRVEYARMGREIADLRSLPDRPSGMRMIPTGQTIADQWEQAHDDAARREILTSYGVRVLIYPRGAAERFVITAQDLLNLAA